MIDTVTAADRPFNQIEPFEFCGVEYARVDGRSLLISERAYMASSRAKDFRDWLTRALAPPPNPNAGRICPECKASGGPDGVTNCSTCAGGFWERSQSDISGGADGT